MTFASANKRAPGLPKGTCQYLAGYGVFLLFCSTLLISASVSQACQWGRKARCTSAWINSAVAIYTGKKIPCLLHVL